MIYLECGDPEVLYLSAHSLRRRPLSVEFATDYCLEKGRYIDSIILNPCLRIVVNLVIKNQEERLGIPERHSRCQKSCRA